MRVKTKGWTLYLTTTDKDPQRFWAKVEETPDCWYWTAATSRTGGRLHWGNRLMMAHTVALELHGLTVPPGAKTFHLCGDNTCVNPAHLEVLPLGMSGQKDVLRFWGKVDKTEDCWLWTGAKGKWGHSQVRWNGRIDKGYRAVFDICGVPIPSGYVVHHECETPACVRPDHLHLMSRSEHGRLHAKKRPKLRHLQGDQN